MGGGLLQMGVVDVTGDQEGDLTDLLIEIKEKRNVSVSISSQF